MSQPTNEADAERTVPPALVGRDRERTILGDALEALFFGRGRLILLGGAAGIGKTALATALCIDAAQRGARILTGRSYDLIDTSPYGPWMELLGSHQQMPDGPPPTFLPTIGVELDIQSRAELFTQVRGFLRALATTQPLILFIDDLHWADPASLDLLRAIARELAALPIMILATYRIDEVATNAAWTRILPLFVREAKAMRLTLHPLAGDAVHDLLRARYPGMADGAVQELTAYLQSHAEGNPFFIGELLHGLEEEGRIEQSVEGWAVRELSRVTVPLVLRQVIARRVARLGPDAERLLRIAAVIGHEVPLAIWAQVAQTSEEELLTLVERAVAIGELRETADGLGVQFGHALIREALYTQMLAARRRAVHRTIAETLLATPPPDPDAVAYHLSQAGDPRAIDWLIRAGDRAQRVFAYQTAIARFTDALAIAGDDATRTVSRCELLIRLAGLLRITDTARAIQYEEEALRLATQEQNGVLQAVARFRLGYLLSYIGQRQRGLVLQMEGLAALDTLPLSAMERVASLEVICADVTSRHGSVAQRLVHVGRLREAERHAEQALVAVNGELNRPAEDAWMALAIVDRDVGRPEEGWRKSHALHVIFRERGEHDIASWLVGSPLIWAALVYGTDDPSRLNEMLALVDAHIPQRGELFATLPIQALHLPVLYVEGAWAEARQIIAAVRRSPYARHGYAYGAWLVHALIAVAQGETDAAWEMVHEEFPGGAETEPGNNRFDVSLFLQRIAATLAIDAGDLTEAESWLTAHDRWLAWSGATLGQAEGELLWARLFRARGDRVTAYTRATRALAEASAPRQPLALLAAHRLCAELDAVLGRYEDADRHLDVALALANACRTPYEMARTLLARAELNLTTGDAATATALLDEVRALAAPLGARPTLARADVLAARLVPGGISISRHFPDRLTAREVEVLQALAAGLSNREIAGTLGINGRTAERHISNLYTKIGANSRTEAVAYAFRHRLL